MYRIVIVEDNNEVRQGFAELISNYPEFDVINTYDTAELYLKNLATDKPHMVLMDINLPGKDGIYATAKTKKLRPKTDILIITVLENSNHVFDALCSGACGYLLKTCSEKKLIDSIKEVLNGGAPMSSRIAKLVVSSFSRSVESPLSERETEILSHLSRGSSYQDIADKLFISRETVKFHIKNIYEKLQVKSKSEAISVASEKRFI